MEDNIETVQKVETASKPWYRSKTIWVNVGALALELLNYFTPTLQPGSIATAANVASIILRKVTTTPLS